MAWSSKKKQHNYWLKIKDEYNKEQRERWKTDSFFREASRIRRLEYAKKYPEKVLEQRRKAGQKRLKLRFEILQKHNFRCKYCGRNGETVSLEIDHIIPKSKGGKNILDNYTVACRECNIGKSDILLKE